MHHEEKWIKGILHYRTSPDGKWEVVPKERLVLIILATLERMNIKELNKLIITSFPY